MVKRDRNHPCVVIWGVGNEETNQGQASVRVRLNGTSGRIVVWVDTAGMFSGQEIIVAMEETE